MYPTPASWFLDSLLEVNSLQALRIDIYRARIGSPRFTPAQIGVVKQLVRLRRLTLRDCSNTWRLAGTPAMTDWLRWLCSLPHRLQHLEEVAVDSHCLRAEHMQMLQRLPALVALEPRSMFAPAMRLLPTLASQLRRLRLYLDGGDIEGIGPDETSFAAGLRRAPFFLPHLTPLIQLTHLTLGSCIFSEEEATELCLALPQLRELQLTDVEWPSLEPLRHLPLLESFSLQQFCMVHSPPPLQLDAAHVVPLTRLRRLTLFRVFDRYEPLNGATSALLSALHPPSALLPELAEFSCSNQP